MNRPDKARIRTSFDRAASSYDAAATVQRLACEQLLAQLVESGMAAPRRLLDAGCGTGYGCALLARHWPAAIGIGADFAPAMLIQAARHAQRRVAADMEALPFADGAFDLWWSSLAIQWCDPAHVLAEAARTLAPGGRLALTTLGSGTFAELRAAFAGVDTHTHTIAFDAAAHLGERAAATGFRRIEVSRETVAVYYPDLRTLLAAVKAIGANVIGPGQRRGLLGKAAWARVAAAYEAWRTPAGLPASYDLVLLTAER